MTVLCDTCGVLLYSVASLHGDDDQPSHGKCRLHELEAYEEGKMITTDEQRELNSLRLEKRKAAA